VNFITAIDWDWSITIPVGACPPDDEVLRRLRRIAGISTPCAFGNESAL
jgi:hypothetical protein